VARSSWAPSKLPHTGFEEPDFHVGRLAGQNGWSGSGVGMIENTTAKEGKQALVINSSGTSCQNGVGVSVRYTTIDNPGKPVASIKVFAMISSSGKESVECVNCIVECWLYKTAWNCRRLRGT
jgi:hypothetical protein